MPGSILNLLDSHSDHSDCSSKSIDSRTSGKKVSFNKAVRVKQYPWQPDEYIDSDSNVLPNQRFWFKVYKTNPNHIEQNSWKVNDNPPSEYSDTVLASLTPIAEDDDPLFYKHLSIAKQRQRRGFNNESNGCESIPFEPPIDYMDNEEFSMLNNEYKSENDTTDNILNQRTLDTCDLKGTVKRPKNIKQNNCKITSNNGAAPVVKYQDFKRPTISSAAKCITERKSNHTFGRLTRCKNLGKGSTNDTSNRNKCASPNPEQMRERRSRSTDSELKDERLERGPNNVDKAVSTDDLSADSKINEKYLSRNYLWWAQKKSKDKSTQCTETLTSYNKRCLNSLMDPENYRSNFLSTPCQKLNANVADHTVSSAHPHSTEKLITTNKKPGTEFKNKSNYKHLSLSGKTLSPENQSKSIGSSVTEALSYSRLSNGKNEKQNESKRNDLRSFPWKTIRSRKYSARKENSNPDISPERTTEIQTSSTVGYIRGRQIAFVPTQLISIPKVTRNNDNYSTKSFYSNEEDTGRGNNELFEILRRERSQSADREYNRYAEQKEDRPAIDWSLSGFRLGIGEENKMSSSSDSECVIHRRAPLLMYIPGVSHHDRPAVEDDRLSAFSGISRSEAEDDISPLVRIQNTEFKRRHSLPRNGKLHWMKWKASKKNVLPA